MLEGGEEGGEMTRTDKAFASTFLHPVACTTLCFNSSVIFFPVLLIPARNLLKQQIIFSTDLSVRKLSEVCRNNKGKEGGKKKTDNEVRRKYFQMRFKIKKETCELDLQIDQEQWKSFRKPADKDKDFKRFIEVSKVSMSLLKLGKHCLKPKLLVR